MRRQLVQDAMNCWTSSLHGCSLERCYHSVPIPAMHACPMHRNNLRSLLDCVPMSTKRHSSLLFSSPKNYDLSTALSISRFSCTNSATRFLPSVCNGFAFFRVARWTWLRVHCVLSALNPVPCSSFVFRSYLVAAFRRNPIRKSGPLSGCNRAVNKAATSCSAAGQ